MKAETALFRIRYGSDDTTERKQFLEFMKFDWAGVSQYLLLENEPLIRLIQMTVEEGVALRNKLNILIGAPEENTDFSGFLKAY